MLTAHTLEGRAETMHEASTDTTAIPAKFGSSMTVLQQEGTAISLEALKRFIRNR